MILEWLARFAVFGDGNPNIDYEEQRWKLVGPVHMRLHRLAMHGWKTVYMLHLCINLSAACLPQVGEYIMSKGGAVTAEQLAPYLDVRPDDLERVDGQVNEDFVVCCPCPSFWSPPRSFFTQPSM